MTLNDCINQDPFYRTMRSSVVSFDGTTMNCKIVVPCSGTNGEMTLNDCINQEDSFRSSPSHLQTLVRGVIAGNSSTLGSTISALGQLIEIKPLVTDAMMPASNAICTTTTTTVAVPPVYTQ